MKQLGMVLPTTLNGAESVASSRNLSAMGQHSSIKNALTMTTGQISELLRPRETPITLERAKQGFQWLRLLKSYRKKKRLARWMEDGSGMEWVYRSEYALPSDMTAESVTKGLIEMVKPCSAAVVQHFVTLQAFKPFFDNDAERIEIVYSRLYDDVRDMPEIAVVLACDDLRNTEEKWFPIGKILSEVTEYRDMIYDALDYFQQGEK